VLDDTGRMAHEAPNTLAHFSINVEDTDRAIAFYRGVFGWTFNAWGPPGFFLIDTGGIHGSLQRVQTEPFPTLIGNFECTIAVDDVDRSRSTMSTGCRRSSLSTGVRSRSQR